MNTLDKQYTALLQDILDNGVTKETRNGGTLSVFGRQIRHKMSDGFPLLTTKKMPFKTITTELLWFLRGDTNIKYLVDNNCHIWDGDAYKNYVKTSEPTLDGKYLSQPEFIHWIKTDDEFAKKWGSLGKIYGAQWRSWQTPWIVNEDSRGDRCVGTRGIDQIQNLINDLKTNPDSRRLMVSAWNVGELDSMTLPPCHFSFQVYTRELSDKERQKWVIDNIDWVRNSEDPEHEANKYLYRGEPKIYGDSVPKRAISLMWNQRSVDTFLGLPFNIASYGLLLEIIAKEVNMVPDELIGNLGDTHLYLNHIEQAKEQIGRELSLDERTELAKGIVVPLLGSKGDSYNEAGIPTRTREPYPLPKLKLSDWYSTQGDMSINAFVVDISSIESCHIYLENYQSHPSIKAPLSN